MGELQLHRLISRRRRPDGVLLGGSDKLLLHDVRQGHFRDLGRETRLFAGPIPEGRPKPVGRDIAATHPI